MSQPINQSTQEGDSLFLVLLLLAITAMKTPMSFLMTPETDGVRIGCGIDVIRTFSGIMPHPFTPETDGSLFMNLLRLLELFLHFRSLSTWMRTMFSQV